MNADVTEPGAVVPIVDLEELTERIWYDLQRQVDQTEIHQVLVDLLPEFQEARILTFVPVLMHRSALDILRRQTQ